MKREFWDEKHVYRRWIISTLTSVLVLFVLLIVITVYIDPFFHFHAPLPGWAYPLHNERCINDGIMRNFEYDAIIIGTSMTENFKTSEADALFAASFIKVPFSGGIIKRSMKIWKGHIAGEQI